MVEETVEYTEQESSDEISIKFLRAYERLKEDKRVKTAAEFGLVVANNQKLITRLKSGQKVSAVHLNTLVRIFSVNPMWFHYDNQDFYHPDSRGQSNAVSNMGRIDVAAPGAQHIVHAGEGGISGNSVIQQAERIINRVPPKFREEIEEFVDDVKKQIRLQADEVSSLKKIIDSHENLIKEIQGKLIEAHERNSELAEKYVALLEERSPKKLRQSLPNQ